MAQTSGKSTLSPISYAISELVYASTSSSDIPTMRILARALNWAFANRNEAHVCLATGSSDWDDYPSDSEGLHAGGSDNVGTIHLTCPSSSTTVIETDLWIDPDVTDLVVGAEVNCTTTDTASLEFEFTGTVGTDSVTLSHTTSNNYSATHRS